MCQQHRSRKVPKCLAAMWFGCWRSISFWICQSGAVVMPIAFQELPVAAQPKMICIGVSSEAWQISQVAPLMTPFFTRFVLHWIRPLVIAAKAKNFTRGGFARRGHRFPCMECNFWPCLLWLMSRTFSSEKIVISSHSKSANNTFQPDFWAKRTGPQNATDWRLHWIACKLHRHDGSVRLTDKTWLKVLFADLLWEKNNVRSLKKYGL
jgi:hypothetical protein